MKERRETNRFSCEHRVILGDDTEAEVLDVGLDGLRLQTRETPKAGQSLILTAPNGDYGSLKCRVRWARPLSRRRNLSEVGVQFEQPLHTTLRTWLGRHLRRQPRLLQRRSLVRARVSMAVQVSYGEQQVPGLLRDVCELGGLLSCDLLCPSGSSLKLEFEQGRELVAEAVSGRYVDEDWHYSLRFTEVDGGTEDFLRATVNSALKVGA